MWPQDSDHRYEIRVKIIWLRRYKLCLAVTSLLLIAPAPFLQPTVYYCNSKFCKCKRQYKPKSFRQRWNCRLVPAPMLHVERRDKHKYINCIFSDNWIEINACRHAVKLTIWSSAFSQLKRYTLNDWRRLKNNRQRGRCFADLNLKLLLQTKPREMTITVADFPDFYDQRVLR